MSLFDGEGLVWYDSTALWRAEMRHNEFLRLEATLEVLHRGELPLEFLLQIAKEGREAAERAIKAETARLGRLRRGEAEGELT